MHADIHPGNLLLNPNDETQLFAIDLGDMHPAVSDNRNSAKGYILSDLRQAVVSLRYLLNGDLDFYAAKRFAYDDSGRNAITPGTPTGYQRALYYVYRDTKTGDVDYDLLKSFLASMISTPFTRGHIIWP